MHAVGVLYAVCWVCCNAAAAVVRSSYYVIHSRSCRRWNSENNSGFWQGARGGVGGRETAPRMREEAIRTERRDNDKQMTRALESG